jgi:hypothetical protein
MLLALHGMRKVSETMHDITWKIAYAIPLIERFILPERFSPDRLGQLKPYEFYTKNSGIISTMQDYDKWSIFR